MEHAFADQFTVGVEEELLLVDAETRRLAPVAEQVLAAMDVPVESAHHEAYAAEIELRSPPSPDAGAAAEALRAFRARAGAVGATLVGAGLHPDAELGDAPLVDAPRYRRVAESMRGLIRRTPECALHVHVGVPDPEAAIRAFDGLRSHLPLLVGLAAASPFWFGTDSGMASARWALVRAYPGRGVPPAFRDYEDYAHAVDVATAAGDLDDYTHIWWDLRPHPRLGTVEVREMDAQSSLDDAAALAALVQALARDAVDGDRVPESPPSEAIDWSAFRAARDGLDATVLHGDRMVPLREAAREAVARAEPHARELGSDGALEGVERILRQGGAAGRQRAAHAAGGMDGLLDALVRETSA